MFDPGGGVGKIGEVNAVGAGLPVVLALLAAFIVDIGPTRQMTARAATVDVPVTRTSAGEQETQLPYHARYYRERHGRPSMEEKTQSQQDLTPLEEKALVGRSMAV